MDVFDLLQGWFSGLWIVLWIGVYIWMALCLQTIAKKTDTPNAWLAWIPIANIYLMCKVADKPGWWTILFFIPIANIVFAVLVWIKIAEVRNQPNWLGILMIVPIANLVVPGILAFASYHQWALCPSQKQWSKPPQLDSLGWERSVTISTLS